MSRIYGEVIYSITFRVSIFGVVCLFYSMRMRVSQLCWLEKRKELLLATCKRVENILSAGGVIKITKHWLIA